MSREVYQYHYLKWPDRDVPTDAEPVHRMLTLVREQCPENLKGLETSNPVVVHCRCGSSSPSLGITHHDLAHILEYKVSTFWRLNKYTRALLLCAGDCINIVQLKWIKVRAKPANLSDCAVPFFKPRCRQLVLVLLYNIITN